MWKVIYTPKHDEDIVVNTSNPEADVKRFLFKDKEANLRVEFNGHVRRTYEDGQVTTDTIEYPAPLRCNEDYANALAFAQYVGEGRDYIHLVAGTTKKQRERILARRLKQLVPLVA